MKHTLLLTGSSGYIGSHFAKYFGQNDYEIVGLDLADCPSHARKFFQKTYVGNIGEKDLITHIYEECKPSLLLHCAALCSVEESTEQPELYFRNNTEYASLLLQTLFELGLPHAIFSSTAATFGNPLYSPIDEKHVQEPVNPYGQSKLQAEKKFKALAQTYGRSLGIFRYFNAAGADPDGELGEDHEPERHLIPNAIRAVLTGKEELFVFGRDYPTRDGTCERDYIHVKDLATAHMALARQMVEQNTTGIRDFNLGLGQGYTILEVLAALEQTVGRKVEFTWKHRRPGDPAKLVANSAKAKMELGWSPEYSDLKTIISTAKAWISKA